MIFRKMRILDTDEKSGKSIWKFANLRGKIRSASHGDIRAMKDNTMTPDFTFCNTNLYPTKPGYPVGQSPLEQLPQEILSESTLSVGQRLEIIGPPDSHAF